MRALCNGIARLDVRGIHDRLFENYGDLRWWPARTPYEVMVGAVLTQNTAWSNVEKAIANFKPPPDPEYIETVSTEELVKIIRPAGFFNQKAGYLKSLTAWYKRYGYSVGNVKSRPLCKLREELLSVKGVGRETADSILLYAFGLPTFVIDAYTLRLITRLTGPEEPPGYDAAQRAFAGGLDEALYNNAHALIVINAKEHCAAKPRCSGCPLAGMCDYDRFMRTKT